MINKIEIVKELLHDFSQVNSKTVKNETNWIEIDYDRNPLNPNLLSYCFDVVLGFNVKYRIFEKINYIIEFDYKGTYGMVGHYKLSYRFSIEKQYKDEIIKLFNKIKPLLSHAFLEMGEEALEKNEFTMVNEYGYYLTKFSFYQEHIELLEKRRGIISDRCKGQWITEEVGKGCTSMLPKCQDYLWNLSNEILYSMEAYVDVFFSSVEHLLTLLYPFLDNFDHSKSYSKNYIHNPKWTWDKKIQQVCGGNMNAYMEPLRRIKEVYRNRNAHGMFSRELKVYVGIPKFGRYPMYIGKQYLRGFLEDNDVELTYEKFHSMKKLFNDFFNDLDSAFEIPMLFIKSGLPVPIDTDLYMSEVNTSEEANLRIERLGYEIDNQSNMDW